MKLHSSPQLAPHRIIYSDLLISVKGNYFTWKLKVTVMINLESELQIPVKLITHYKNDTFS